MRKDQAPEWVPEDEAPPGRSIRCGHCDHTWQTRAAGGQTLRCPACRRPKRVPSDPAPASRTAPAARTARPAPAPRTSPTPVPMLADLLKLIRTRPTPAPAPAPARLRTPPADRPAPAPRPAARPPAAGPRPWEIPGQRLAIGPQTTQALSRIGLGPLTPAPQSGSCSLMDARLGRPCHGGARQRAVWDSRAYAPVCDGHAYAITTRSADRGEPVHMMDL